MFHADDILAAATAAFAVDADMVALVPGGLWHRRAPGQDQKVAPPLGDATGAILRPYAVAAVTPQDDKEFISNRTCLQSFLLVIRIFGDEKVSNTGQAASYLCAWDLDRSLFQSLAAKVLGIFPAGEILDLDPEEKAGQDVVIASKAWALKLHYSVQSVPTTSKT
jgi:hypothetical protein